MSIQLIEVPEKFVYYFAARAAYPNDNGCWLWTDTVDRDGYGNFRMGHKTNMKAHRLSWLIYCGPIPKGICVCHRCDTPACVNPDHLFLGTNRENQLDKVRKGRQAHSSRNGRSKLTDEQVQRIRRVYRTGRVSSITLGKEYGVSSSTILGIIHRTIWAHVE